MELHFLSLHHHEEKSSVPIASLAVGFCASCCLPVTQTQVVRKEIDGEHVLFCSDECGAKILPPSASVYSHYW